MTEEERSGFCALLNATMRFVHNGETYESELRRLPQSAVREVLLQSTREHLVVLRKQADDLEKLGLGAK